MGIARNSAFAFTAIFSMAASVPAYHYAQGHLTHTSLPEGQTAEAVMVFTGASNRIVHGYNFMLANTDTKLMITGKDYPGNAVEPDIAALSEKADSKRVYIDTEAGSTIDNAVNGANWALTNNIKSILLVTSNPHMWRSYFELRRLLPKDIIINTATVTGFNLGTGLDSERTRLLCRMYETVVEPLRFCYQTRHIARQWGVLAMNGRAPN